LIKNTRHVIKTKVSIALPHVKQLALNRAERYIRNKCFSCALRTHFTAITGDILCLHI